MVFDFLDIVDRAMTGEVVDEAERDMALFRTVTQLVKELDLKYDGVTAVPSDNTLADEVFDAGLRLAIEVGAYCITTQRRIAFTEEELTHAIREPPTELTIGAGKDAVRIRHRTIEDPAPPPSIVHINVPITEALVTPIAQAVTQLPVAGIRGPNFYTFRGRTVTGMPLEVVAQRRQVEWVREGVKRAGKPGLHVITYPISPKAATVISALDPTHIRTTDAIWIATIPELCKLEYDLLTEGGVARDYGCCIWGGTSSMPGGFAGGWEGSAIALVACTILAQAVLSPNFIEAGMATAINPRLKAYAPCSWSRNLSLQALVRNTNIGLKATNNTAGEPCTEQYLMEYAYNLICCVPCGVSYARQGRGTSMPKRSNLVTPLEVAWGLEIVDGAAKMTRREADAFLKAIAIPRERLEDPPTGRSFDEAYDTNTLKPKAEYVQLYKNLHNRFEALGFPFE